VIAEPACEVFALELGLLAGDGTTREFAGWLGLLNVLERLLPDSRSPIDAQERSAPIATD
jgi:hypothetical protein